MSKQLIVLALGVIALAFAEDSPAAAQDLAPSESGQHYGYYPSAPAPLYVTSSEYKDQDSHGYGNQGYLAKGYGSHGHGNYGDHGKYAKQGYASHGGHLATGYGDHGAYGAQGGHQDHYGKKAAYVRNSGHGYEKSYSYDKQVHLHDVDAHKSNHHAHRGDHGAHGYKNAAHHSLEGHKALGSHDKYGGYGYGKSGHLKSGYGSRAYGKHTSGKNGYGTTYGAQYIPVYSNGYGHENTHGAPPGYYSYHH